MIWIDSNFLHIVLAMQNDENSDFSLEDSEEGNEAPSESYNLEPQVPLDNGLMVREKQSSELLYIIFTNYRKEVQQIAKAYQCQIRIAMSSYMLSNSDSSKKQEFGRCCKEITNFINSINYQKLGNIGVVKAGHHVQDRARYNHSPFFSQLLKTKNIALTSFQEEVFVFSRKLAKDEIKREFLSITKDKMIFPVRYNKTAKAMKTYNPEIYHQVDKYLLKIFDYYGQFLKERNIVAELNNTKSFIYLIGEKSKFLMESKCTMKNVIESIVCLIIKYTNVNNKTLEKFLEKASTYPIHLGRLNQKQCIIISKDNILKQIINKSASFFKHIGIDLEDSQQNKMLSANAKIGIFAIRTHTFNAKIQNSRSACKEIGYDLFYNSGVYYINQVFYQEGKEKKDVIRKLLSGIMVALEASKQRFEAMSKLKNNDGQKNSQQQKNPLKYILKGGRQPEITLSKIMKRDVLTEKVQMKKQFNITFNVIETKEQVQYWILENNGEAGEEVNESQLKPGRYLRGLKKTAEDGTVASVYEEIITVI